MRELHLWRIVVNAAVRGRWDAAGWTFLFNVLANGYPAMLQRYNRALLAQRFGLPRHQDSRRRRPDYA